MRREFNQFKKMKKNIIIGIGIVTLSVTTTVFAFSLVPSALENQERIYNEKLSKLLQIQEEFETIKKEELNEFCLLVDYKKAERVRLTDSSSVDRYTEFCPKIVDFPLE